MNYDNTSIKNRLLLKGIQVVSALIAVLLILLVIGYLYQQQAEARDLITYPPPGEMIDVGGFDMHLNCIGSGSPTIILESGLSGYSLAWWTVHEQLAQLTRTCTYDRVGLGWSESTGDDATRDVIVENLHTLLTNAGETPPFVLVGHSAGSIYVREYAITYPNEVAGLILVDGSHW